LRASLASHGLDSLQHESGCHTEKVLDADLIVLSPGVPSDIEILKKARQKGIPIWSEMELGFRASRAPFCAVTGSTGKSTTVSLIGEAIRESGKVTVVAGNIGIPVISQVERLDENACVVAEVSSFQLETIELFKPKVAAIVNLMKNHLDRYESENDYYNAKKRIAANMAKDNYLVVNATDPQLREWAEQMRSRVRLVFAGANITGEDCFWVEGTFINYRLNDSSGKILDTNDMKIKGYHNYLNACIAAAVAKVSGADDASIERGICSFKGLEHRLEFVEKVNGVGWYNDSKSTTAESIVAAVKAFKNVFLIAGGRDKGCEFETVKEALKNHARAVYLIGEAAQRIKSIWEGIIPIHLSLSLEDAVTSIYSVAEAGDTVVMSPGCSSFDMFKNYEERGAIFRRLVKELPGEHKC
ncbi:MAG TPA: UDP-N-acetylmuramoyl-L-alanine--D-glutamate ligase, partial [Chitinispirillaceae bacterium]|nr:UDP-N-acetylmuramoyl-L-alanine--D-glutamate ligase [Chitinispirillaceae bacterium]